MSLEHLIWQIVRDAHTRLLAVSRDSWLVMADIAPPGSPARWEAESRARALSARIRAREKAR